MITSLHRISQKAYSKAAIVIGKVEEHNFLLISFAWLDQRMAQQMYSYS